MLKNVSLRNIYTTFMEKKRLFSDFVKIVEVGPRDGLQNEKNIVPTKIKIEFINKLSKTGLKNIEVTSFVSPKWVPQMADNADVFQAIEKKSDVSYPVLVPNLKGLEAALKVNVNEIAVFSAASETFSKKNTNCSIEDGMREIMTVITEAQKHDVKVRGYVSCAFGCPYETEVKPAVVANLTAYLLQSGCYEISLGDTIGVGTPKKVESMLQELKYVCNDMMKYAMHFHDTYGRALVNVYTSLQHGIRIFDSSVAGLGGCPYAAGASGNVATEDLLYFLQAQGLHTGVNLDEIVRIGDFITKQLGVKNQSKAGTALLSTQRVNTHL